VTVTFDVPPELDEQLKELARAEGMTIETYLTRLVAQAVSAQPGRAASTLLQAWEAEDFTEDPEELARREREWEALKEALNANRSSERTLFP
jgi:hypothetical protein